MIKVGQIYKQRDYDTFVVSYINKSKLVSMIYTDGSLRFDFTDSLCRFIQDYCELIAEYPTWREAVNSKEFNNGTTN